MQQEEQEAEGGLEVLEADLAEMENSVYHLVRSNVEIAQVRCPVKQFAMCSNQAQTKAWIDVLLRGRACCAAGCLCLLCNVQGSFRRVFFPRCRLQATSMIQATGTAVAATQHGNQMYE